MTARLTGRSAIVTGRTIGHLEVTDGSFRPFVDITAAPG